MLLQRRFENYYPFRCFVYRSSMIKLVAVNVSMNLVKFSTFSVVGAAGKADYPTTLFHLP